MKTFVLTLSLLVSQQQTAQPPAALEGTVLRAGTTDPLPRSRVILNAASPESTTRTVMTDDAGRFAFRDLPAGRYQLLATRDGYVRQAYGQRGPNGSGTPIVVAPGQPVRNVTLSLTPAGAISGRIRNHRNEPAANVAVRALKVVYEAGHSEWIVVQTARTDDRGEYRLYYLEPGQYMVSAIPPLGYRLMAPESSSAATMVPVASAELFPGNPAGMDASTAPRNGVFTTAGSLVRDGFLSPADTGETYVPVFFPGVPDPSGAAPIQVDPGAAVGAVDFAINPARAVNIRGQVVNGANGQPQRGVSIVLLSPGSGSDGIPVDHYGSVSESGAFEFRGVAPGVYELVASAGTLPQAVSPIPAGFAGGASIRRDPAALPAAAGAAVPPLAGRVSIKVGSTDLENVGLELRPGVTVNGRIAIEGLSLADSAVMTAGMIIQFQPDPPDIVPENRPSQRVRTTVMPAAVGAGGAFSVMGAFPGVYQIGIVNAIKLPSGAYVKSARFGEADALGPRLRIDGQAQDSLEIVIGTNPGSLDATIDATILADGRDGKQPPAAITVVLVPDAPHRQHYDLYRFGVSDDSGHARFEGVVPGGYTAYALEDVQHGSWWDPDFAKRNEGRGKPLHVDTGGKHALELKAIPRQ